MNTQTLNFTELEYYLNMLNNINDYKSDDFEYAIIYIENIKDNYRLNNKEEFEKYDKLQEKFYEILEKYFNICYENFEDKFDIKSSK